MTDPPHPAAGGLRRATPADRPLMLAWWGAFVGEARVIGGGDETAVDSRMKHGGLYVWEHDGPVSMVGVTRPVGGAVRVGPVYTPVQLRGRGYAGAAVAAVSRQMLEQGTRTCILYTDLANPTSNKIYAEVGYRRFINWEEREFGRG